MKRAYLAALIAIFIISLYSCTIEGTQYYNPYRPYSYNFVTESMISNGEKLKEEFPDEDFLINKHHITYTFAIDEQLLKKDDTKNAGGDTKKRKKKEKTIYRSSSQVITVTEGNLERSLEKLLKDVAKSDWPKSGVTITEKNEMQVVALDDLLDYEKAIFYTDAEALSGIKATYGEKESSSFIVSTYNKSYEQDGIFHDDVKYAYMEVPMYVVGNTLDLEYTINYNDYRYLSTIYFPEDYRLKEKTITLEIPEGLEVEVIEKNFEGYDITRTEGKVEAPADDADDEEDSKSRKKKSKSKSKSKKKKSKKRSQSTTTPKNTKIINYTIKNAKAMKGEYANYGPTHSAPHLLLLCKSYTDGKDTTMLMNNADDLYKWYNALASKMENDSEKIATVTKDIVKGKTTDDEKIKAVFYWVQDNIRYLAFEDGIAGFKPDESQNVYEKRYGDCKGMANLTKEMLKTLGYDARLTWIGTDRIAYEGTTPTLSSANHMICAVFLDSSKSNPYFLDATEKYVAFGDYANRIQGRQVIIEDGEKYIVAKVPVYDYKHNKIEKTENYTVDGKILSGSIKETYNGESKTTILSSYNSVKLDSRERALRSFLSNNDFNITVDKINHSDFSERGKPFEINYDLKIKNRLIEADNKLYINPDWEREWANYTIDTARYSHYSFRHKKNTNRKVNITIPAGYKVEKLPAPLEIINDDFIFRLSYTQQGNTIVYKKEIIMPNGFLHRNRIKEWNTANAQLSTFYDKYIVLTK